MEKISLKADYAFKELFAHEKVRKQFLSDVLGTVSYTHLTLPTN